MGRIKLSALNSSSPFLGGSVTFSVGSTPLRTNQSLLELLSQRVAVCDGALKLGSSNNHKNGGGGSELKESS